jgi:hypothetical protein
MSTIQTNKSDESMSYSSTNIPACLKVGTASIRRGIAAKKSLARFSSENSGTFTPTNNVVRFPISSTGLLSLSEAKFSFDLTNTGATDAVKLDCSAACVIRQLRVIGMDGTELERINNYNLLDNIQGQYLGDMDTDNIMGGGPARQSKFPSFPTRTQAAAATKGTVVDPVSGLTVACTVTGATSIMEISSTGSSVPYRHEESDELNINVARHYEVGLRSSGWFNTSHKRLLPGSTPFILELTLADAAACLVRTGTNDAALSYSVTNPFITVPVVSIQDVQCLQHMEQKMAQGLSWSAHTYKHHVNTIATGTGALTSVQINDRSYDLTAMLSVLRPVADLQNVTKYSLGKYSIQGVTSVQYEISNTQFPPQALVVKTDPGAAKTAANVRVITSANTGFNVSRLFSEVKMVLSRMGQPHINVSAENFGQSELNNGTGFLAIDLASYTDSSTNSGIDTKSVSQNVSLQLGTTAALGGAQQIDTYCLVGIEFSRMADGRIMSVY